MADNMLIDGLIKFCDEKSKNIKLKAEPQVFIEIKQALEELRAIKSDGFTDHLLNMGYTKGYNKAIDEFADMLSKYLNVENATKYGNKDAEQQRNSYDTLMKYEIADAIDDIAEQMRKEV